MASAPFMDHVPQSTEALGYGCRSNDDRPRIVGRTMTPVGSLSRTCVPPSTILPRISSVVAPEPEKMRTVAKTTGEIHI
jgi:hypothetical protein